MSSWRCLRCRTTYAVGLAACPHCGDTGYSEGGIVAKASAEGGATHYVAEGDPVPDDLPPEVRLVGPGAPAPGPVADPGAPDEALAAPEPAPEPEVVPDPSTPDASSPASSDPGDDLDDGPPDYAAYRITDLRDLARERGLPVAGSKADLVARLAGHDAGPA